MGRGVAVLYLVVLLALWARYGEAWGSLGHKAVAQVAYDRLSPQARAAVDYYLNGATLPTAAVYPDTFRSQGGAWSGDLHFVNFPRNAVKYEAAYCPGNPPACVVTAIANYTRLLAAGGLRGPLCLYNRGDQPCPLSFLAHFVGDIHQPLHCGYADDKGGNTVDVRTFWGKSTNLHSLWDSGLLEHFQQDLGELVYILEDAINAHPEEVSQWLSVMEPSAWAEESFQIVRNDVYNFTNVQERAAIPISQEYYAHNLPIVLAQLAAAGVRLAGVLNRVFG